MLYNPHASDRFTCALYVTRDNNIYICNIAIIVKTDVAGNLLWRVNEPYIYITHSGRAGGIYILVFKVIYNVHSNKNADARCLRSHSVSANENESRRRWTLLFLLMDIVAAKSTGRSLYEQQESNVDKYIGMHTNNSNIIYIYFDIFEMW